MPRPKASAKTSAYSTVRGLHSRSFILHQICTGSRRRPSTAMIMCLWRTSHPMSPVRFPSWIPRPRHTGTPGILENPHRYDSKTKSSSALLSSPRKLKLQCAREKLSFKSWHKCVNTTLSTPPEIAIRLLPFFKNGKCSSICFWNCVFNINCCVTKIATGVFNLVLSY